jgi:hypothetical protein
MIRCLLRDVTDKLSHLEHSTSVRQKWIDMRLTTNLDLALQVSLETAEEDLPLTRLETIHDRWN